MGNQRISAGIFANLGKRAAGISLLCLGVAQGSSAQEVAKWYINAATGWHEYDPERLLEDESAGIFGLERRLTPNWAAELSVMTASPQSKQAASTQDGRLMRDSLNALYYFSDGKGFEPYLSTGIGHTRFRMESGERDDETHLSLALGARYLFNPRWSLRAEARYLNALNDSYGDTLVSFGVSYSFGKIALSSRAAPEQKPALQIAAATSAPLPKLDSSAAPEPDDLVIRFAFDSAEITEQYRDSLRKVAQLLKSTTGMLAVIEGHADSIGAATYNMQLSQRRVKAVEKFLIEEYGVESRSLRTAWQGESQPIADNDTSEGRHLNRRVLIVLESEAEY